MSGGQSAQLGREWMGGGRMEEWLNGGYDM